MPILRPGIGGQPEEGLVALSGVFTTTNGAWTVPVEIDSEGNPSMDSPGDADTFKQGFNGYQSARLGLYSPAAQQMHMLLFGGISLEYLNDMGQVVTDQGLPFVNDITSVVVDENGKYSQHWLGQFPELTDLDGKRLYLGSDTEFFPADALETFRNGVLNLDSITTPKTLGYVFGGIAANGPHVRGVPGVTSSASNTIFEVVLIPVPEPNAWILAFFASYTMVNNVCASSSRRA